MPIPGPGAYNLNKPIINDHEFFAKALRKNDFLFQSKTALETPGPGLVISSIKKTGGTFS